MSRSSRLLLHTRRAPRPISAMRASPPSRRPPAPPCACGRSISAPCSRSLAACRSASARRSGRPTGWSTWRRFSRHLDIAAQPRRRSSSRWPATTRPASSSPPTCTTAPSGAMKLCGAVFAAVWVQERNIADPKVLEALAAECGLDAPAASTRRRARRCRSATRTTRRRPSTRKVFGAPSYLIDGEIFWGQDRLRFRRTRPEAPTARRTQPHTDRSMTMGQFIDLTAKDGFSFPAYVAEPAGKPKGAVVESCRRSSASTRTSARWPTATRPRATWRSAPATFHRVKPGRGAGLQRGRHEGRLRRSRPRSRPCRRPACCRTSRRRSTTRRGPARSASSAIAGAAS